MNLDKTSNLGQKFAALNIVLYRKLLHAIAGFIQVKLFLPSLFIDNVKSHHLYVVWQMNHSNNTRLWNGSHPQFNDQTFTENAKKHLLYIYNIIMEQRLLPTRMAPSRHNSNPQTWQSSIKC